MTLALRKGEDWKFATSYCIVTMERSSQYLHWNYITVFASESVGGSMKYCLKTLIWSGLNMVKRSAYSSQCFILLLLPCRGWESYLFLVSQAHARRDYQKLRMMLIIRHWASLKNQHGNLYTIQQLRYWQLPSHTMSLGSQIQSNSGLDQTNSVGLIKRQSELHLWFHYLHPLLKFP